MCAARPRATGASRGAGARHHRATRRLCRRTAEQFVRRRRSACDDAAVRPVGRPPPSTAPLGWLTSLAPSAVTSAVSEGSRLGRVTRRVAEMHGWGQSTCRCCCTDAGAAGAPIARAPDAWTSSGTSVSERRAEMPACIGTGNFPTRRWGETMALDSLACGTAFSRFRSSALVAWVSRSRARRCLVPNRQRRWRTPWRYAFRRRSSPPGSAKA